MVGGERLRVLLIGREYDLAEGFDFARTAGLASAAITAASRRSTTALGVSLVVHRPCQNEMLNPGTPDSIMVGVDGDFGQRCSPITAIGLELAAPPHWRASARLRGRTDRSGRRSNPASPARRRDTARIETARRSSAQRTGRTDARRCRCRRCRTWPGPALPSARRSAPGAVFGGRSFLPTIHSGEAANSAIGCRSLNMS